MQNLIVSFIVTSEKLTKLPKFKFKGINLSILGLKPAAEKAKVNFARF